MLYTRKGDTGTTKTFGCDQRVSKSSNIAEALGSLDEINSFLGLIKIKAGDTSFVLPLNTLSLPEAIGQIQQDLFIIQAELAGAPKTITQEKVLWLERIIDGIEKTLPPIKTFFVSGGTLLAAQFDFARTLARRAEREVIRAVETGEINTDKHTLTYLNRLSSLCYALARFANFKAGVKEQPPKYK